MPDPDPSLRPTRSDIVNCYRVALGREPESADVVEEKLDQPAATLLASFFASSEFSEAVQNPRLTSKLRADEGYGGPITPDITAWTAGFAPLSSEGRDTVRGATSWYGLFGGLFEDPVFTEAVAQEGGAPQMAAFLGILEAADRLAHFADIRGGVDVFSSHEISGWAVDTTQPDRMLALELHLDGVFAAAGSTGIVRPDLQSRTGGGRPGFIVRIPAAGRPDRAQSAEIREAASGRLVEAFRLPPPRPPPLDAAMAVRREIADLRRVLDRLEARLPDFGSAFSFTLDTYGDYFETYYAPQEGRASEREAVADLAVVLDASGASMQVIEDAVASVARQRRRPRELVIVHPSADFRLASELLVAEWRCRLEGDVGVIGVPCGLQGWAVAMNAAVQQTRAPGLLFFRAGAALAADAVGAVSAALATGAALVYADEDHVRPGAGTEVARHSHPQFRSGFDYDLLLQQDYFGSLLGVARRAAEAGFRPEHQGARLYDLILRTVETVERDRIIHLPRILLHSQGDPPGRASKTAADGCSLAAARDHLGRVEPSASVEPHEDILGAATPSSVRVRRPVSAATTAAIIIPTRDRLELLAPCIDSIVAASADNAVRTEILVVDNRSTDAATVSYLADATRSSLIRVIEHDGAFNWALMNNRAAEQTDADVLVFLNNDTVVLSPDWCDELCGQALRPKVGAVGARLLYEDGTLQHAGVVIGGHHSFAAHEGVGAPGGDAGYLGRHALVRQVCGVTGACLATRAEVFRAAGGFDALNLPVESNDIDYCFRLRARGLDIIYDPHVTLYHFESKSRGDNTGEAERLAAGRANLILRGRWAGHGSADPFYNAHFDRLYPPFERLRPPKPADEADDRSRR